MIARADIAVVRCRVHRKTSITTGGTAEWVRLQPCPDPSRDATPNLLPRRGFGSRRSTNAASHRLVLTLRWVWRAVQRRHPTLIISMETLAYLIRWVAALWTAFQGGLVPLAGEPVVGRSLAATGFGADGYSSARDAGSIGPEALLPLRNSAITEGGRAVLDVSISAYRDLWGSVVVIHLKNNRHGVDRGVAPRASAGVGPKEPHCGIPIRPLLGRRGNLPAGL